MGNVTRESHAVNANTLAAAIRKKRNLVFMGHDCQRACHSAAFDYRLAVLAAVWKVRDSGSDDALSGGIAARPSPSRSVLFDTRVGHHAVRLWSSAGSLHEC
ncbi:hypothetical protein [Azohydromonas lata]|uniref:Uncharacterized protein n=1 Tax=Azohydromonas lata TaxID=45677 RepID=A0ABU5INV2_9BURK|nr:hypothetical protein [Azohydromonas lata]MDZ5460579.1 hypothetical protein [Azohydromonas lata]